jgi:hypothetical protein
MKATTVKLVQMVDGVMIASETKIEHLVPFMSVRGFEATGHFQSATSGRFAVREEIAGQPKFAGLAGPMYDGPGVVRYEDARSNDALSA